MYIYGGYDINEGTLDTLWMLDMARVDQQPIDENDYLGASKGGKGILPEWR